MFETDEIVLAGPAMPTSPRWHDGRLWLPNSGAGASCSLGRPAEGRSHVRLPSARLLKLPLLCFCGPYAPLGLSKIRERQPPLAGTALYDAAKTCFAAFAGGGCFAAAWRWAFSSSPAAARISTKSSSCPRCRGRRLEFGEAGCGVRPLPIPLVLLAVWTTRFGNRPRRRRALADRRSVECVGRRVPPRYGDGSNHTWKSKNRLIPKRLEM